MAESRATRERFEKWADERNFPLEKESPLSGYAYGMGTQLLWECWQAALSPAPPAISCPDCDSTDKGVRLITRSGTRYCQNPFHVSPAGTGQPDAYLLLPRCPACRSSVRKSRGTFLRKLCNCDWHDHLPESTNLITKNGKDGKLNQVGEATNEIVCDSVKGEGETAPMSTLVESTTCAPSPEGLARECARIARMMVECADNEGMVVSAVGDVNARVPFPEAIELSVVALLGPHLERVERWIPVSERLPEADQIVLAYADSGIDIASYRPESKMYRWDFDTYGCEEHEITHWRPLPAAPDTEKA